MSILTNKMPNLTENAKVLILSKLEEGCSIRRITQYYCEEHRAEDKIDNIMVFLTDQTL
jgi:hypothetical protein